MKKLFSFAVLGLVLLTGCSKGIEYLGPEPEPTPEPQPSSGVTAEEIKKHAENVLGVAIPADQDWISTTKGSLTINANSSVEKVAVMALVSQTDEEGETFNSMTVLNEAATNGKTSVKLNYDVPSKNEGLYAAFYTADGCLYEKVEGNSVSLTQKAKTRAAETDVFTYPEGEFKIADIQDTYATERGYHQGAEKLYKLADADYAKLRMDAPPYSEAYAKQLKELLFAYFPNGRGHNNLPKVMATGYSDDNAYRTTTGDDKPIVVCPIYKNDGGYEEVISSDLYYYYFKQADLDAAADKVAFLQDLPKYKLIPFGQHFANDEDDVLAKTAAYACLYYGDGAPSLGTKGSFHFPEGYKIGFMVRAMTDKENGVKKGELYFDGRLNTKINTDKNFNFKSSNLKNGEPRATWFKFNDRVILCWESGTDTDYNDILLEVEGSVTDPEVVVQFEYNTYTYCFEDRQKGDYDMNDVVIKAKRLDATHVQYAIVACGAYDNLFVKNINAGVINDDTEIHSLFGKGTKTFINTGNGDAYVEPVVVTKEVSETFSFLDEATQPYLLDKTTGLEVKLAKKGEDPHGIMLPYDFQYPLETVCIKDAYEKFNEWVAKNKDILSTDWYTKPTKGKVYTK